MMHTMMNAIFVMLLEKWSAVMDVRKFFINLAWRRKLATCRKIGCVNFVPSGWEISVGIVIPPSSKPKKTSKKRNRPHMKAKIHPFPHSWLVLYAFVNSIPLASIFHINYFTVSNTSLALFRTLFAIYVSESIVLGVSFLMFGTLPNHKDRFISLWESMPLPPYIVLGFQREP